MMGHVMGAESARQCESALPKETRAERWAVRSTRLCVCLCSCGFLGFITKVSTSGRLGPPLLLFISGRRSTRPPVEGAESTTGNLLPIRVISVVSTELRAHCILFFITSILLFILKRTTLFVKFPPCWLCSPMHLPLSLVYHISS